MKKEVAETTPDSIFFNVYEQSDDDWRYDYFPHLGLDD